ncbi:MAG: branched-chain amino acid ABC transporter permease [Candidatus Wallbacteria bacterium]|nr:branched-chain amino acid ABC transporter permease [Candidatus Wallbacteria bacterium]
MLAQILLLGVTMGAAYALIAVGYTMVYGIIELINFAHGEIYMYGAFMCLAFTIESTPYQAAGAGLAAGLIVWVVAASLLAERFGRGAAQALGSLAAGGLAGLAVRWACLVRVPFALSFIAAVALASMLGVAIEIVAYRPLRESPRLTALITAIGVSLVLQNVAQVIWSAENHTFRKYGAHPDIFLRRNLPESAPFWDVVTQGHYVQAGPLSLSLLQLFIALVAFLLMLGLHLLVMRTKLGMAMRACAQDQAAARLMGIDVNRVISLTFALGSALGAVAGILVGLYRDEIKPTMGYQAGVFAFSAAVLGGIGNIPGAMVGGLVLGVAQSLAIYFDLSEWATGVAYFVMISVIVLRPAGLMGAQLPRKS